MSNARYNMISAVSASGCKNDKPFCVHKVVAVIVIIVSSGITVVNQIGQKKLSTDDYFVLSLVCDAISNIIVVGLSVVGMTASSKTKQVLTDGGENAIELNHMPKRVVKKILKEESKNGAEFVKLIGKDLKNNESKPDPSAPPKYEKIDESFELKSEFAGKSLITDNRTGQSFIVTTDLVKPLIQESRSQS
nr:VP12 [Kadipiro virus]WFJ61602.1 VP12 [Kadipiro virus]WFJ61603.1 VP12 [Kadipiro virus]WFJ61604.1 VP12 [Kadipiro virus]